MWCIMKAKNPDKKKQLKKEPMKLDQMMSVLFRLSKHLQLQLLNGLFGENFARADVKSIHYGNAKFDSDDYNRIIGDLFMKLDTIRGVFHYHVEFQTLNNRSMVIRMFRYGFEKALELVEAKAEDGVQLPAFPKQLVIFLEQNKAIGDELRFRLRLPDGTETMYAVPVLKLWTLTPRDMQERKLFALLPLQVFRSRKRMRRIALSQRTDDEKQRLLAQEFKRLKTMIEETVEVLRELRRKRQLRLEDLDKMLQVLQNILNYLYRHYGEYKQTEKEVNEMIKTFIPEALKRGRREGRKEGERARQIKVARNLLELGVDRDTIVKATELSTEEIESLARQK
ncbi:putative transposase/invertase (TIGR01784 family) [Cohnella phaseoli]|uniref:Putative transposase/invertase (TIGR01784 family) n=2 Tax=Cohnella phaseoli TaxID=456490 RepID=A0A3D9KDD3_9BACL|nr:putative transposase/invertase (TIGR01784 family) [Cohnella phaseoli]